MLHSRRVFLITITVSLTALLTIAAVTLREAHYALADEPTVTPTRQAETVVLRDEPFPWWDVLTGIGTLGLAVAALYAAFVSLSQYLQQRRRETDLDLAKLHGDLVGLLRQEHELARGTPDEGMLREELARAEFVYEGILRGVILVRPELMKAAREALREHLQEALRQRGGR